jgi:hypothetical protein
MTGERRRAMDDDALAEALRGLVPTIAWPTSAAGAPDPATRVRVAILAGDPRAARAPGRGRWWTRPVPRALVLALVALLVLAALAGAVGLGLPGLRLLLGGSDTTASPPPSAATSATPPPGAPGSGLGLGRQVALADLEVEAGRPIALPTDPRLGPPDAAWVDRGRADQVALVWAARPDLPATLDPGIGLILMSFDGTVEQEFFGKAIGAGTTVDPVSVGQQRGFWISALPHLFWYETGSGGSVDDPRRWVGDALLWSDGTTTWRIESALGREATLRLAETVAPPGG